MAKRGLQAEAEIKAAVDKAAEMPDLGADLGDPGVPMSALAPKFGQADSARPDRDKGPAEWACERMIRYIRSFEAELDADQEVAMGFAGSEAGVLQIEGLSYYDPDLLTFYGRDEDGNKTQLIQHLSQLSVMLRAVPKATPEEPARRIGFHLTPGWMGGDAGDGSV